MKIGATSTLAPECGERDAPGRWRRLVVEVTRKVMAPAEGSASEERRRIRYQRPGMRLPQIMGMKPHDCCEKHLGAEHLTVS